MRAKAHRDRVSDLGGGLWFRDIAHTHMYIRVDNIIGGRCNSAYNAAYDKHAHKKVTYTGPSYSFMSYI